MLANTGVVNYVTLPNGERLEAKNVGARVQGMFLEMMLKSMEDSIQAEDGLFGNSSSAEIYRGMLREQLGKAMGEQLKSSFDGQLQRKLDEAAPGNATDVTVPVVVPALPVDGVITSPVGWRSDPFDGSMQYHKGTDIAARFGSDVKAVAGGVVIESGAKGSYGNVVVIRTDDGQKMLYGHNQDNLVRVGDRVEPGEVIAHVGATGRATGPHVHFEIME